MMAMKFKIILLLFVFLFLSTDIYAKESLKSSFNIDQLPEFILEPVIVKGDDSMRSLRREVIRAQEFKFDLFNSLNSTDEFDIKCKWYTPLGTRVKKWGCNVGYMMTARNEDAGDFMIEAMFYQEGQSQRGLPAPRIEFAWKKRALHKEMIKLAVEHPELAIAMVRANAMQQFYEAEHRKRYGKHILVGNSKPDEKDIVLNEIDILEAAFLDHSKGKISDEIWERWDRTYRKLFNMKTYQIFWTSAHKNKDYADEFVKYMNSIIPEERQ